jgi:hypothetical protein
MADLAEELRRLDAVLEAAGAPIVARWRPGMQSADIVAQLEADGVHPHPDLIGWYRRHDGTDTPSATRPSGWLLTRPENHVCLSMHLPTLEQARIQRGFAVSLNTDWEQLGLEPYRHSWYPVLISSDGWHVCLDTDGSAGPPGTLFVYDPHAGDDPENPEPWFPNLAGLVSTIAGAYESGVIAPADTWVEPEDLPEHLRKLIP